MTICVRGIEIAGLTALLACAGARAQDIEPRAYSNAPVGVNFLIAGYGRAEGGLVADPSLPIEDADLATDALIFAYARSFGLAGRSAKFDAIVPFTWVEGTADYQGEGVHRRVSGFGDARLRVSWNLFGAPALPMREFAAYRQDTILGVSVQATVPVGQYDDTKVVNIGTNRWAVKPEVGISKAIGRWTLESAVAMTWFGDNADFYGGHTREQDPVYSLQGGVVYGFPRGVWLAVSGTWYTGGRTAVDGRRGNDLQRNSLAGITLAWPLGISDSVKLYASKGLATRIGSDADTISLAWQHRWGGGL